jgi:hypothetical protein
MYGAMRGMGRLQSRWMGGWRDRTSTQENAWNEELDEKEARKIRMRNK